MSIPSADGSTSRATSPSSKPYKRSQQLAVSRWLTSPWPGVLKHPVVTAPIVGPTKLHHLPAAVEALDVQLTDDDIRTLEEPYGPHLPTGF